MLTPKLTEVAHKVGCRNPAVAFEHFHQDALAKGRQYADWNAAWHTRMGNHERFGCPCQTLALTDPPDNLAAREQARQEALRAQIAAERKEQAR